MKMSSHEHKHKPSMVLLEWVFPWNTDLDSERANSAGLTERHGHQVDPLHLWTVSAWIQTILAAWSLMNLAQLNGSGLKRREPGWKPLAVMFSHGLNQGRISWTCSWNKLAARIQAWQWGFYTELLLRPCFWWQAPQEGCCSGQKPKAAVNTRRPRNTDV